MGLAHPRLNILWQAGNYCFGNYYFVLVRPVSDRRNFPRHLSAKVHVRGGKYDDNKDSDVYNRPILRLLPIDDDEELRYRPEG